MGDHAGILGAVVPFLFSTARQWVSWNDTLELLVTAKTSSSCCQLQKAHKHLWTKGTSFADCHSHPRQLYHCTLHLYYDTLSTNIRYTVATSRWSKFQCRIVSRRKIGRVLELYTWTWTCPSSSISAPLGSVESKMSYTVRSPSFIQQSNPVDCSLAAEIVRSFVLYRFSGWRYPRGTTSEIHLRKSGKVLYTLRRMRSNESRQLQNLEIHLPSPGRWKEPDLHADSAVFFFFFFEISGGALYRLPMSSVMVQ